MKGKRWTVVIVVPIVLAIAAVIIALATAGAQPSDARKAAERAGLSNVRVGEKKFPSEFTRCSEMDRAAFEVHGTSATGQNVDAIVCIGGLFTQTRLES